MTAEGRRGRSFLQGGLRTEYRSTLTQTLSLGGRGVSGWFLADVVEGDGAGFPGGHLGGAGELQDLFALLAVER